MTMATKKEVFKKYLSEYLRATKERQGEILNTICEMIGMHRKAAIRKFHHLQMESSRTQEGRGRREKYGPGVTAALKEVWEAASEVCGELLTPALSEYVDIFKRDKEWSHRDSDTALLLEMSERTVKRRLATFVKARTGRGISATRPSALKHIIPIFTGPWSEKGSGYGQIDTVVHCGYTLAGDMAFTLNYTDVATSWNVAVAQWNKGQRATLQSMQRMRAQLPFDLKGIHPDSGSEFINFIAKGWCDEEKIELTRSRPYHKNDNAYVEQKNGHVVRRFLGYTRIDKHEAVAVMNSLYGVLNVYLNHFVPTRKCLEKVRIGSRYKRNYSRAQTPYARVLARQDVPEEVKLRLEGEHALLNPRSLKRRVEKLQEELFILCKRTADPLGL